ncbi:MAG TPA: matrixin family metalloprotease [Longimicrobium sp.]
MDFAAALGREIDALLGTAHRLAAPLPIPAAWRDGEGRVRSDALVDALLDVAAADDAPRWRLAVTDAELAAPGVGRVFGEAAVGGGCAAVGLGGLDGGSRCGSETLLDRATKAAVHELAHAAGLAHCADPICVMYPSLHIADTDRKAKVFCTRCREDYDNATLDAARS